MKMKNNDLGLNAVKLASIEEILAAAPIYAQKLRKLPLARNKKSIEEAKIGLYANLAYLLAIKSQSHRH